MSKTVYIVSIDIKDGWYDIIHGFTNREAADAYVEWQKGHSGDHCYVTEVELLDSWVPPEPSELAERAHTRGDLNVLGSF
jgi:hypothetical protein